jgi:hypothetical protein
MGKMRNAHNILERKPENKKPLLKLKSRCEDNIKMGRKEMMYEGLARSKLALDRYQWRALVDTARNVGFQKGGAFFD